MPQRHTTKSLAGYLNRLQNMLPGRQRVRVRLAPSPTGALHIGTARTALFNYLFARKHRGRFVLRIEDTDLERSDKAFEKDIVEQLHWLGITWDEGIDTDGKNFGRYGPYRQSERGKSYAQAAELLLREEKAYFCFCSKEQLDADRQEQQKKGAAPKYVGTCQAILPADARTRIQNGENALLRLRMPEEELTFDDLIRGAVTFDTAQFGDIAIAKAKNGGADEIAMVISPLYNFAVVLDDSDMQITHVLRGEDHIANTPKQIVIAQALEIQPPLFGHLPLILGPDRSKLSKRHGATTIKELREAGYYPEAVVNFLALMGFNPGTDELGDLFSLHELIEYFNLSRVQQGGAMWDRKKLQWLNHQYSRQDIERERLEGKRDRLRRTSAPPVPPALLKRAEGILAGKGWKMPNEAMAKLLLILLERNAPDDIEQAIEESSYFFATPEVDPQLLPWKEMRPEETKEILQGAKLLLEAVPGNGWREPEIESILLAAAEEQQNSSGKVDRGRLLWPLRVALTGEKRSPGPFAVATILGREETLKRVESAIARL